MRLNLSHDEQIGKSHGRSIDPEDGSAAALSVYLGNDSKEDGTLSWRSNVLLSSMRHTLEVKTIALKHSQCHYHCNCGTETVGTRHMTSATHTLYGLLWFI